MKHRFSNILKKLNISLALAAGLMFAACGSANDGADSSTPTPTLTQTPWPTLAPVGTPQVQGQIPAGILPTPSRTPEGPRLIEQFRADLTAGVTSVFQLNGEVDVPLRVEVIILSGDVDPALTIRGAGGDQLAFSDTAGLNQPEVIGQFLFPSDGFYELGITAIEGEGQVGVSVYHLDPAALEGGGVFTSLDQELQGVVDHPNTYQTFRFTAQRGQRFDLWATAVSENLDLLFEVYGPDGALIAARDDNVGTDPYLWNYMPSQSGVYTVVLSNFADGTGEYSIGIAPSQSGQEAVLSTRSEIELQGSPRKGSWVTLNGRELDGMYVEVRPVSPGVDVHISVFDPYGNRLHAVDQGGVGQSEVMDLVMFPFDGEYQVEMQTLNEGGTVEYYILPLSQFGIDQGGKLIPGGQGRRNEITGPGTVITYWFEANAGTLIGIDAHAISSTGLDLAFDLFGPDGTLLLARDDVVGKNPVIDRFEVPTSGRYTISVWNYDGTIGTFDVYVTNPEAPATPPPNASAP